MTRDAKIYTLLYKDWKQLAEEIKGDESISDNVAIFQLSHANSGEGLQGYAVISTCDKADKIIEGYGGQHEPNSNLYFTMPNYKGEPLFGNTSILAFVPKRQIPNG